MSEEEAAVKIQSRARGMNDRKQVEQEEGYRQQPADSHTAVSGVDEATVPPGASEQGSTPAPVDGDGNAAAAAAAAAKPSDDESKVRGVGGSGLLVDVRKP